MNFKEFFFGMSIPARDQFAARAGTSRPYLYKIAYRRRNIELGAADVLVALAGGAIDHDDLPLTAAAKRQRVIRATVPTESASHG